MWLPDCAVILKPACHIEAKGVVGTLCRLRSDSFHA
jgi:hypothetical protein